MIKANELRIGNKIKVPEHNLMNGTVAGTGQRGIILIEEITTYSHTDLIEPIQLTPDILEAAGFKNDVCIVAPNDAFILQETAAVGFIPVSYDDWQPIGMRIEYLHQLQNLYFALTGTELEINMMQKA